jgi:hypothetical protein
MRGAIERALTDDQLNELCDRLAGLTKAERNWEFIQNLLAKDYEVTVSKNAVYTLLNGPLADHMARLKARRERAEAYRKAKEEGGDFDENFINEDSAAELGFVINDYVTRCRDDIDPSTAEGDEIVKKLGKLEGLVRMLSQLRKDDRELRKELTKLKSETVADLKDKTLSEEQRAARMRARFGV